MMETKPSTSCPSCGSDKFSEKSISKAEYIETQYKCSACCWGQISLQFFPSNDITKLSGFARSAPMTCYIEALLCILNS